VATAFQLNLPLDIPWKRICVTQDMLDRVVCDETLPPKWQSSLAIYKYTPEEDYQFYPDYDISYLKVTATITGYQALEDEIQGQINWNGVNTTTVEGASELLKSYFPCTGAIVQVVVGPHGRNPDLPLDQYPFFLDFEPKKRELYEMATDTKERQSRSSETLQLTKSAGKTQSQEVLDVDMGGSFGAQGSYAGTGGGFTSSNQGQWGTKSIGTQQSQTDRRSDVSRELREGYSFTTQLSQMYHLLDSYHLGTNRAVFFVQPRPHVLEEPTGFVRGPRKVEGIQEFFLVVAQPKETPEYCVSARLDTAHLMETDLLEYETPVDVTDLASATARIPTDQDQPANPAVRALATACFIGCWDVRYRCFMTSDFDDVTYSAPTGFSITGFNNLVNQASHGSSSVTIAPGNKTLTVHAEANGHIAIEAGWDVCADCPDELMKWAGSARRQVQVNLRSDEPTVKTGTQLQLLITTRGLCCCEDSIDFGKGVIGVQGVPAELGGITSMPSRAAASYSSLGDVTGTDDITGMGGQGLTAPHMCEGCAEAAATGAAETASATGNPSTAMPEPRMTIRQANALGDFIKERLIGARQGPDATVEPAPFIYTDAFTRQMMQFVRRSRRGRELLDQPAGETIPGDLAYALAERLGKNQEELTARDVLSFRSKDLAQLTEASTEELAQARAILLGIQFQSSDDESYEQS
jgi:hypothetical protein